MKSRNNISKVGRNTSEKLRQYIGIWLVYGGLLVSLLAVPVWAAEAPDTENQDVEVVTQEENSGNQVELTDSSKETKTPDNNNTPIEPTKEVIVGDSDEMDRDMKTGITILTGNVKTIRLNEQGEQIGFLNADKVTLKSDPDTGKTTEIIAVGNVEIRDQEIFATCDHATMDNLTSIITLKDNVVVLQNKDRLETKLFTFNRITGKQTGIGGVKFKVEVTQATPTETVEESQETDSDIKDATDTPDTTEKKTESNETENEEQKNSDGDSEKSDTKEKDAPADNEKEKAESKVENKTEETESKEEEKPESDDTEDTGEEETDDEDTQE